ncbi:448_t:CDS:2, partial [Dentiscutata erythropus]
KNDVQNNPIEIVSCSGSCNHYQKSRDELGWSFKSNISKQSFDGIPDKVSSSTTKLTIASSNNNSLLNYILITFTKTYLQNTEIRTQIIQPISTGHLIWLRYSLIFKNIYASRFNFFTGPPEADIDVEIVYISPIPNSSYTILLMKPKNQNICYEAVQNNVFTFLASIGGFYYFMTAFYILLFGSPKYSPWGYCQTCPCWWPFRRNYKRHLAKQFICKNGRTLFVDDPLELISDASSIEDKINVLGNRLIMLEDLLKKFYLDTSYLKLLKETREKYITLYRNYKELEQDITIEEGSEIMI